MILITAGTKAKILFPLEREKDIGAFPFTFISFCYPERYEGGLQRKGGGREKWEKAVEDIWVTSPSSTSGVVITLTPERITL